jgi:hypothetical protein
MMKVRFILCILMFVSITFSGCMFEPYSVVVSNSKNTGDFLRFEGIDFDQVWIPQKSDLEGIYSALKTYLESNTTIKTKTCMDREYVLAHLPQYNREYSGFVKSGTRYIVCNMILLADVCRKPSDNEFTIILDGGCGIVRVVFEAKSKTVVHIDCNGMG